MPVQAVSGSAKIETSVSVADGLNGEVSSVLSVTNGGEGLAPQLVLPAFGRKLSSLSAQLADGKQLPAPVYDEQAGTVTVSTDGAPAGAGEQWSVTVRYMSEAGRRFGGLALFMSAPVDSQLAVAGETLTLSVPLDRGMGIARGAQPASARVQAGRQVVVWRNDTGPLAQPVGLMYEKGATTAAIDFKQTLSNGSFWWRTKTITLPSDTNQQKIVLDSIEPKPSRLYLDSDGNILADYRLGPRRSVDVTARLRAALSTYTYDLDSEQTLAEVPAELKDGYTAVSETWPADEAWSIDGEKPLIPQVRERLGAWVKEQEAAVSYEERLSLANRLTGALRGSGVPARLITGYTYNDGLALLDEPAVHAWSEAYLPGVGWMTIDPAFEQGAPHFGVADGLRVAMAIRGVDAEVPPDSEAAVTLAFGDEELPAAEGQPSLASGKHMILPGLAVRAVKIAMPAGSVTDKTVLKVGDGGDRLVGSLAPLQEVTLYSLALGSRAFTAEEAAFSYPAAAGEQSVKAVSTIDWRPMALVIFLFALLITLLTLRRKRASAGSTHRPTRDRLLLALEHAGDNIEHMDLLPQLPQMPSLTPRPAPVTVPVSPEDGTIQQNREIDYATQTYRTVSRPPLLQ